MKTQSWWFVAALAMFAGTVVAQQKLSPAEEAQITMTQRAEALTEAQINDSRDLPSLTKLAQIYAAKNDNQRLAWVLHRATQLMPNSGDLKLQLALVYAALGDKSKAYDTLLHMQTQGFGYDVSADPRFEPVHGTRVWDYIVENLKVNSKPFGEGKVAFQLPAGDGMLDAIAWDAKHSALLVGSQHDGSIVRVDAKGKSAAFIKPDATNGLWAVDALGVDSAHDKLYVATSSPKRFAGFNADNANKSAVLQFDLSSGKLLKKFALPNDTTPRLFNALAVTKDGTAYVVDGAHKIIFKLEGDSLKAIVQNPKLTGISSIAISDDGRTLYLADYALGIFGYDLSKGAAFEVKYNMDQLVVGGIVGMAWYQNNLLVVQDGMVPKRVMRMKLSADGHSIESTMPLDVANAAFLALGPAALAGDDLYYIANRQGNRYDANGLVKDGEKLQPVNVFRSNARFAWGQAGAMKGPAPLPMAKPDAKLAPGGKPPAQ